MAEAFIVRRGGGAGGRVDLFDYWMNPDGVLDDIISEQAIFQINSIMESARAREIISEDMVALNAIMGSLTAYNSVIASATMMNFMLSKPKSAGRFLSSPYILDAVWNNSDYSTGVWDAGEFITPSSKFVLTLVNGPTSTGKAIRIKGPKSVNDNTYAYWGLKIDFTGIDTLKMRYTFNEGSSNLSIRIDGTQILSKKRDNSNWDEIILDVSSYSGVGELKLGLSHSSGVSGSNDANLYIGDMYMILEEN